jgi:CRP/FNR family transcriptional regulator, cyclic AMP receptor protein
MPAKNAIVDLFSALPQHVSALLFATAKPVYLAADQMLFVSEDPGDGCCRIEKGLLKVSIVSATGGERILAIPEGQAELLASSLCLTTCRSRPRTWRCATASSCSSARPNSMNAPTNIRSCTRPCGCFLSHACARPTTSSRLRASCRCGGRVALTLIELAEDFGESVGEGRIMIRQKFGQSDLAAMAGIARENVNRIIADWKRRKLISRMSGYYCIESKSALQQEISL